MLLIHYFMPELAHSSYLLAGSRTCAVIDPARDPMRKYNAALQIEERDLFIRSLTTNMLHGSRMLEGAVDDQITGKTGKEER